MYVLGCVHNLPTVKNALHTVMTISAQELEKYELDPTVTASAQSVDIAFSIKECRVSSRLHSTRAPT